MLPETVIPLWVWYTEWIRAWLYIQKEENQND